jgi:hypothetical protein
MSGQTVGVLVLFRHGDRQGVRFARLLHHLYSTCKLEI